MRWPAVRMAMAPALVLAVLAVAAATAVAADGDVKCAECGTGTVPALPPPPPYYYYSPPPPASYPGVTGCPPPPGGYISIGGSPPGRMYPQDPGFMPSSAPPMHGTSFAAVPFTVCALAALATLRVLW
ncbi:neural Wiskott-Aldrich syndrome protein-like [Lolium rigidum]|uniref:neural Wiskott-Aldrich syndrome protein-like n=1 Tax=Lolium rigidum TaxID=89674 RepID=UPI001F5C6A67|nr:neural Wiskott-Aldrich syndrome protein-like [Lolium rigidum]